MTENAFRDYFWHSNLHSQEKVFNADNHASLILTLPKVQCDFAGNERIKRQTF